MRNKDRQKENWIDRLKERKSENEKLRRKERKLVGERRSLIKVPLKSADD